MTLHNSPTTSYPKILVIIVTWNKKDYVLNLLDSVKHLDYPAAALDLLVVDNASDDGSVEAIRAAHPDVNLLCNEENLGGTGGFNTGLRWAFAQEEGSYDYLWLLDNDVLVHRYALNALVDVLEANADIAVAGSTMMQLDYPWRINEMGAFVDRQEGTLILNRHFEELPALRARQAEQLIADADLDLSRHLENCRPFMDVDYVAAASLLIRADVARQAGTWLDFFIHFDDVEWCLRIGRMGHRVVVSARSLMWHLSAAAKIPTWVLYYDNRNILELMREHGASRADRQRFIKGAYKRALYYALLGKQDLSDLHHQAVEDFRERKFGKKAIQPSAPYRKNSTFADILQDKSVRKILVGPVNLQATGIQEALVEAVLSRPELEVDFTPNPDGMRVYQVPRARFLAIPRQRWKRWLRYWQLRGQYDISLQSDYQPILGLAWVGKRLLFINDEGFCEYPRLCFGSVWTALLRFLRA